MDLANLLLDAGLGVAVAAALIAARAIWITLHASGGELLRRQRDNGLRLDLYLGLVWLGMLLVQAGNILLHRDSAGFHISSLTLVATAGTVFICGACAGRLLLRAELRRLRATDGDETAAPSR